MPRKTALLAALINRMEAAVTAGHYFEASWYASALIEDRLVSLLRTTGGTGKGGGGRDIRMIGEKLKELQARTGEGQSKNVLIEANTHFKKAHAWKEARNELMHAMADSSLSLADIDRQGRSLAEDGVELVKLLSTSARRLKKHLVQTPSVGAAARLAASKTKPKGS